jgi:hypothetical protein
MSGELNALTQRLYAQGYTRDSFPDNVCWGDFQNFSYKWDFLRTFTWETPCGLMIQGDSGIGRSIAISDGSYQGVWYCPENDNALLRCPYGKQSCEHIPAGFPLPMCPCHQTKKPYDYEQSIEKIDAEQSRAAQKQYMELTGGAYCACVVGSNGYQGGWYEVRYDVDSCIHCRCENTTCVIRKQARDLSRVNVFYDIRRTWITRIGFLEEKHVEVTKGVKVFPRPIARTDAEIWLQTQKANYNPLHSTSFIESPKKTLEDRRQEFFSKQHRQYLQYEYFEFHYDVENIRIARSEQRDLLQDLRDAAEGIEVVHAIDQMKEKAAKKRAARKYRKDLKARKAKRPIAKTEPVETQLSLFDGGCANE